MFFFFSSRRRHTRCSRDWSSDVCSSDLFVTDPQGAAVAGAKVTLSSGVRADLTKETIADGSVVFPLVTPGTYKVTVEAPNFSRTVLSNVDVAVTAVTNLSVKLEIGQVSTEVQVAADVAETVNTTNATLGDVLTDRKSTRLNSSHGYISYAV